MTVLESAPDGAVILDLDKARVARAELAKDLPFRLIHLSAGYVEVKHEVDILCAEDFTAGRITDGLQKLLADPADIAAVIADGVTNEDFTAITAFVTGKSLGE